MEKLDINAGLTELCQHERLWYSGITETGYRLVSCFDCKMPLRGERLRQWKDPTNQKEPANGL